MDFEDDWSLFCKEAPQKVVPCLQNFQVGSVSFNTISIPGRDFSCMETLVTQELYQSVMGGSPPLFVLRPQNPSSISEEDMERLREQLDLALVDTNFSIVTNFEVRCEEIAGGNPSYFAGKPQNPVENITWFDAQTFCDKLSSLTGQNFRLPTSEEWEFSALGGLSSFDELCPITDYGVFYGAISTAPVKSKKPNGYGLYDMIGNVRVWTSAFRFDGRFIIRGCGWTQAWPVNVEGASFDYVPAMLRTTWRRNDIGFRCVKDLT